MDHAGLTCQIVQPLTQHRGVCVGLPLQAFAGVGQRLGGLLDLFKLPGTEEVAGDRQQMLMRDALRPLFMMGKAWVYLQAFSANRVRAAMPAWLGISAQQLAVLKNEAFAGDMALRVGVY